MSYMTILTMPEWKSKILRAVAWLLGMRGEHVYCITLNVDLKEIKKQDNYVCQDCTSDSCSVCNA